jgi:hypothetical protein
LLPLSLCLIVAYFLPVFQYFRVLFLLPAYLLLLAFALSKRSLSVNSIAIGAQLIALVYFWVTPRFHKEDWRTLATTLLQNPQITIAMPSRNQNAPLKYYGVTTPILEPKNDILSGSHIYYIRYAEDLFDPTHTGQAKLLSSGYTLTKQTSYTGLQVDIYENHN